MVCGDDLRSNRILAASVSRVRTHTLAVVMASPRGNKANTNDFATESFKWQLQQLIQTPRQVQ